MAWGANSYGGVLGTAAPMLASDVASVKCTQGYDAAACAALKADSSVVTWGWPAYGARARGWGMGARGGGGGTHGDLARLRRLSSLRAGRHA